MGSEMQVSSRDDDANIKQTGTASGTEILILIWWSATRYTNPKVFLHFALT